METSTDLRRRVNELRDKIHQWNYEYYIWAAPTVPDSQYDEAFTELKEIEAKHPELEDSNSPTRRVGAPLLSGLDKVKHKAPMLSLEKAKAADAIICFFNGDYEGVVEPKVDGCSLSIFYINGRLIQAVTRGNGAEGEDVTHNVRTIRSLPLVLPRKLNMEVRGEVFIKWSDFDKMNAFLEKSGSETKANPRNAAAGALSLKDPADAAVVPLSFIAYGIIGKVETCVFERHTDVLELLEEMRFITPSALPAPIESTESMFQYGFKLNDLTEVKDLISRMDKARKLQDFPTDGLVFKVNDLAVQREMGTATTSPRWAIAYKYAPDRAKTVINAINWTVKKTGKINPVAELATVLLSGSRISSASLCNPNEIKRLNVNVGDVVLIEKSNEIIPKVVGMVEKRSKTHAVPPENCPVCKKKLTSFKGYVDMFCVNPVCKAQAEARLVFAVGKTGLDIDGCGPAAVAQCMENQVMTLADLFEEAKAEDGFPFLKGAARKKMVQGVTKALEAPFWRKLASLCIDSWGKQTCQEAAARWPKMEAIIDACDSGELKKAFGDNKAENFDLFLKSRGDEVVALTDVKFLTDEADATAEAQGETAVRGKAFCITGELPDCPRHVAEEEIRKRGGITKSGVGRKLDFLVVGDRPGSVKITAARRWGTKALTPDQLFELMGWRPPVAVAANTDKEY